MKEIKPKHTYLMTDNTGLFKIGQSVNPKNRLKQLKTGNPSIELVCFGLGVTEKYLHELYFKHRVNGEWFKLDDNKKIKIKDLIINGEVKGTRNPDGFVEFINNKRVGRYYSLSDSEKKKSSDAVRKSDKLSEKYIITFGKYKDTKIVEMVSNEQYEYCVWLYNEMTKNLSNRERKQSRKYKAFYWAVKNNKYKL